MRIFVLLNILNITLLIVMFAKLEERSMLGSIFLIILIIANMVTETYKREYEKKKQYIRNFEYVRIRVKKIEKILMIVKEGVKNTTFHFILIFIALMIFSLIAKKSDLSASYVIILIATCAHFIVYRTETNIKEEVKK